MKSWDCSQINKYKGLEADVVLIIDTDKVAYDDKVLYTQASRAKHLLYLFEKAEHEHDFQSLNLCFFLQ